MKTRGKSLLWWRAVVGILILLFLLLGALVWNAWRQRDDLYVYFLNVGQGDAILIRQGMQEVLIDGGRNGTTLLSEVGRRVPFWDRTIELVIATHPDEDHIGGLIDIFSVYRIGGFLETSVDSDTQVAQRLSHLIEEHAIVRKTAAAGSSVHFGNGALMKILWPTQKTEGMTTNEASIVTLLSYRDQTFLFTGDLPNNEEVQLNVGGEVDILKVGHHGSKYSTSDLFLDRIKPRQAILSVGKNSYGHPSQEVLGRLLSRGIDTWRTDEHGTIRYRCTASQSACELSMER